MLRGGLLEDVLTQEDRGKAQAVVAASDENFMNLAETVGLDRRRDLRHIDLSYVDFSDCDLRGCDFTGSDLRGTTGSNVVWDATTIFTDADVERSLFAYELSKREIIARLPELGREYAKIRRAYWSDQTLWVMDSLLDGVKNQAERQALAMALYFDAKDAIVRSTILQYLVFGSAGRESRIEFLIRLITDRSAPKDAVISAIRLFGQLLRDDLDVIGMLLDLAEGGWPDMQIRREAMLAALRNRYMLTHNRRILRLIRTLDDPGLENVYIRAFARAFGLDHYTAVSEGRPYGGLDFRQVIDLERLREIALNTWRARQSELTSELIVRGSIFPTIKHRADFLPHIIRLLKELVENGVDLKLDLTGAAEFEEVDENEMAD